LVLYNENKLLPKINSVEDVNK